MNAFALLVLAVVALAGAGAVGLRLLVEFAERRRGVRWAHALARFCGDGGCRVCRSRSLSAETPRVVPG
ncbi:hypothetical protein [Actinomadura sp. WMMB 499]|uniref:hypothetical protein n=1 Tax=Actinomadura sp. WMMB 499 TaxID=1219491 RepID=UPI001247AA17|nr:hypothetical protein [Actinomadura sp. WMMB 499]QFG21233.1 hypothetical protein F7P10_08875 [Actinomadura sp. WMMB 499]